MQSVDTNKEVCLSCSMMQSRVVYYSDFCRRQHHAVAPSGRFRASARTTRKPIDMRDLDFAMSRHDYFWGNY